MIDALRRDWELHRRSGAQRAMLALASYRFGRWSMGLESRALRGVADALYGASQLASEVLSGVHLGRDTEVGDGLHFVHGGNVQIHDGAKIGARVGIMQGVTIGVHVGPGAPVIGDDVFIGANASVLGPVTIGAGARIAANSLVITDVPPGATAIGVPAKIIPARTQLSGRRTGD